MWKRWNDQGRWGTRERPITYPEEVRKSSETVACAVGRVCRVGPKLRHILLRDDNMPLRVWEEGGGCQEEYVAALAGEVHSPECYSLLVKVFIRVTVR